LWRACKLNDKPNYVWDDAGYKFLLETQHKATHQEDKAKLNWLQQHLRGVLLSKIDRQLIARIGEIKAQEASPSTANRYLALIRSILRKAVYEWEWLDKAPKIRMYREPKRRVRWLKKEQVINLLSFLPEHQRDIVLFALATGLRQANVAGLEWSQVDMHRSVAWIHNDQAKGKKAFNVPLNSLSLSILARQSGKHPDRVFTYKGKPVANLNTRAWRNALKCAEIENFRWHDLRHTWASWLAQAGVPMNVLQELGAWESESMVRRYAHLAPSQLAHHSEAMVDQLLMLPAVPEDK
jgi:integrase